MFVSKIGIDLRIISKNEISIDAIINFLNKNDIKEIFFLLLDEMIQSNSNKFSEIYKKKFLDKLSKYCKTKKYFSKIEALYLIDLLFSEKNPLIDPKGRQVFTIISDDNLDNFFK